ncbi:MAG: zinc ribbon domain-containing protein [Sedimenticola sp.]|nr:zinc ribbon domain-containing protein [Sedimenticola sp.]
MFCPECGTENPDGARFCGNCRHPLASGNDAPSSGPVIEVGGNRDTVSDGLKYGVLAGTLLIPFIGLVMGLIYLAQGASEAKKEVGRLWLYASIGIMVFYFIISGGI